MFKGRLLFLPITLAVIGLGLVACGGASDDGDSVSTFTPGARVSANNASMADLQAAFEHAGISYAGKWAREVDEYRPYPEDDPNFVKLRGELAKYNPAVGVVDQIVAQLELP